MERKDCLFLRPREGDAMTETLYDRWKTTTPDDGPEEPTEDELDARDAMIDWEIEERKHQKDESRE